MEFTKDIQFNNNPVASKDLTVTYNGFLANSAELWIVYGFGANWDNTTELKMEKSENGFSVSVSLLNFDTFNFCFRNGEYNWDNNNYCNFITPIQPCSKEENTPVQEQTINKFDIDALIEEILQPIIFKPIEKLEAVDVSQFDSKPIDLGAEITRILSSINDSAPQELFEYSSLDEILCGSVIDETPIELFEKEESADEILSELIANTEKFNAIKESNKKAEEVIENPVSDKENDSAYYKLLENELTNIIDEISSKQETSLITLDKAFEISPRKLSKFYMFRKRIKLALYKLFIKLPSLIWNTEED